jgi:glycine oxidase
VTGCEVSSLATENSKVTGVNSDLGFWPSGDVVIAAGSWSGLIKTDLTHPPSVKPSRGQMIAIKAQGSLFKHIIYSSQVYFVPRRDGRLLLGSTVEWVGFEKSVTLGGLNHIISAALDISPAMKSITLANCWSGLRPYYEEGMGQPLLGETDIEGLYFATGHFRNGILLAPVTAELMAELIVTRSAPKLLQPFGPPSQHN